MKKLIKEFKAFITRGSVVDLAVGMIIGAAFTAIVTALVDGVLKPLINAIPMGDMSGLVTMLRPVYMLDADGKKVLDMTNSVYIDWGDFVTAIVNFLLTAVILFLIIKAINALRDGHAKLKLSDIDDELKAELKAKGLNRKQMREYAETLRAEKEEQEKVEAEKNKPETVEQILSEIRDIVKTNK